jgi:N-acetylneuraminic acid mutarotase
MNSIIARPLILLLPALAAQAKADTWEQRFPNGTPPSARYQHTAVWTGSEMIVWGGWIAGSSALNTGGRYDPVTNSWTEMSTVGAPTPRIGHTAVWTGSEMIVWGGQEGPPFVRINTGGSYNPISNSWAALSTTGAPERRALHTAVWTGSEMIIWGGSPLNVAVNTGGRYDPVRNSWTTMSTIDSPGMRYGHTTVWTGSEMIVWGGYDNVSFFNSGGRYNAASNSWEDVTSTGAPAGRFGHTAVWTGSEMFLWGGSGGSPIVAMNTGGRYDPIGNSWTTVSTTDAPTGGLAVWTGSDIIVWGGSGGGRYDPEVNSWTAVTSTGAPDARFGHTAVWTGSEMIVWGGRDETRYFNDTFSYTPDCEELRITSVVLEGGNILVSFPSVTGHSYTLWQSDTLSEGTWTDTGLPALSGTGATLTFTVSADIPGRRFFRVQVTTDP